MARLLNLERHWCPSQRGLEKAGGASPWVQSVCSSSGRQEEERLESESREEATDPDLYK